MFDTIKLKNVPQKPGVYLWKDIADNVIYVGKAKNLQRRMLQYFTKQFDNKTLKLVGEIANFDYIITNSENEALTLEFNLIKKYVPRFNVLLMDDKRYPYIRIQLQKILSIRIVRKVSKDDAYYYGPFPNGFGALNVYRLLMRLTLYKNGMRYEDESDTQHWQNAFLLCKEILKPNNRKIKESLKNQMLEAANNFQFEIASDLKKVIESLDFYISNNDVDFLNQENIDVVGIVHEAKYVAIAIMFYRYGKLLSKQDYILALEIPYEELISQFFKQFYERNLLPHKILLEKTFEISQAVDEKIVVPQKGKYKRALELAAQNARDTLTNKLNKYIQDHKRIFDSLEELARILDIPVPHHILMVDNSHLQGENPVSVIVSYKNGIKQTHEYKKFNLSETGAGGDVQYMEEALRRYFSKNAYPDLLFLDGGIQQLNMAKRTVDNSQTTLVALVKDANHHFDFLINEQGKKINIENLHLRHFLQEIQFEVDRFAKSHFRKRFLKNSLESKMDEIPGVGKHTIDRLINHFKSFTNIYNATQEELETIVSKKVAEKIINKFKN